MAISDFTSRDTPKHSPGRGSPITFGIEIEAVVAFHESELQKVLRKYYESVPLITKHVPRYQDWNFMSDCQSSTCRTLHPSWILTVPNDQDLDTSLRLKREHTIQSPEHASSRLRGYLAEPLIIMKEALAKQELPVDVRAELLPPRVCGPNGASIPLGESQPAESIILRASDTNTSNWTLTTDNTVIGLLPSQLQAALGSEIVFDTHSTIHERVWDSAGFELISPILQLSELEIAHTAVFSYMSSLTCQPNLQVLHSKWAALHIHIGLDFDTYEDAPLSLLQHFAYIMICHEDLISKLHPRSRCGLPYKTPYPALNEDDDFDPDAPSPTKMELELENETLVNRAERLYTGSRETKSNKRFFIHNLAREQGQSPNLTAVKTAIFDPDMTVTGLINLLQKESKDKRMGPDNRDRGYMYNLNNISAMKVGSCFKTPKPTIEFRQHDCTIDPDEIMLWVDFCHALVKLAEKMAYSPTKWKSDELVDDQEGEPAEREGSKYPLSANGKWPCNSITKFCGPDFLNLKEEDITFWQERFDLYQDDRPGVEEIDESEESHAREFENAE